MLAARSLESKSAVSSLQAFDRMAHKFSNLDKQPQKTENAEEDEQQGSDRDVVDEDMDEEENDYAHDYFDNGEGMESDHGDDGDGGTF
jgi:hypothetical protein